MKRISMRSWAIWLLIGLLLGGTAFFVGEFFAKGEDWVMYQGNPHVYEAGTTTPAKGTVLDRDGNMLLQLSDTRTYASSARLRAAMVHWLGDREGNIYAPLIGAYTQALTDYSAMGGVYTYGGQGGKLCLTLSGALQEVALEAMGDYKGTVALYNYKTGQILCAVTTPNFDPEDLPDLAGDTEGKYEAVYVNRFTRSVFIPGSIFKIVTTAAAMEAIPDILRQSFTCTGVVEFGNDKVTCANPHGTLDIRSAMVLSCNCAYAQIALQLGADRLQEYVDKYQVLESVSFDGITTAKGSITLQDQADVQVAWSAIGQHKDQINPCSFLCFVGAIANGGQGVRPYIVSSAEVGGTVTYSAAVTPTERIMSEETAAAMQQLMRNNVVYNYDYFGTNFPGLTVCAKSGTGQVGGDQEPNALFAGFVADESYPVAFIAVVEDGGYGQTVCVPIISQLLAAYKAQVDGV